MLSISLGFLKRFGGFYEAMALRGLTLGIPTATIEVGIKAGCLGKPFMAV
jgi:hypothetical protein